MTKGLLFTGHSV